MTTNQILGIVMIALGTFSWGVILGIMIEKWTSIQVGQRHLESETGACINHNCNPNAEIIYIQGWDANGSPVSSGTTGLVSLTEIDKGKEITFNYNLTESILANPFKCNCCGKEIKGKDYEL